MKKYYLQIGLILTAVIWGSGFPASAIALEFYTPLQIMAVRFVIGSIILALVFYKKLNLIKKSTLLRGAILGLVLYSAFVLQTVGLVFTTPSKNAFLTAINIIIVPLIGYLIYRKKLDKFEVSGAIIALIGVGFIALHFPFSINLGDLLTIGCAVFFAIQIYYTTVFVKNEDAIALTVVQMATAGICGVIGIFLAGETTINYSHETILPLLYLGVFATAIAYILQTIAQKTISETKTAIILSTESLWGMIFSVILLSEVISFKMAIGATLILFAILLTETKLDFKPRKDARTYLP